MKNENPLFLTHYLAACVIVLVVFLAALLFYHRYRYDFDCGDLELKIGGGRLQAQGREAYFYTSPDGSKVVNGVVSTPLLNVLHTPLIGLNSCQVKNASFWINFTLLFLCLFFSIKLAYGLFWPLRYILCAAITLLFVFAKPFFTNLWAGQIYLLFTLIFFLLLYLCRKKHYFLVGFLWGFAIAVRPFFLAGVILVLLYYNRKIIIGLVTAGLVVLLITLITGTAGYWQEYSTAMKKYANQIPARLGVTGVSFVKNTASIDSAYGECKGILRPGEMDKWREAQKGGVLKPVQFWLAQLHININNPAFYSAMAFIFCLAAVIGARIRFKEISNEKFVLLIFILYQICEICAPAHREVYNSILWLFALSLIITMGNIGEITLMIFGLLGFVNFPYLRWVGVGELFNLAACFMFLLRKSQAPYNQQWPLKKKWAMLAFKKMPGKNNL